jgi:hypothetical protein
LIKSSGSLAFLPQYLICIQCNFISGIVFFLSKWLIQNFNIRISYFS